MEMQNAPTPVSLKPYDSKIKILTLNTDKGYEFNLTIKTESNTS